MKKITQLSLLLAIALAGCTDSLEENTPVAQGYSTNSLLSMSDGMTGMEPVGDRYNIIEENPFVDAKDFPLSTFSIDADGASYANIRRFLNENQLPPAGAIRTEEFINYFKLNYPEIENGHPISVNGEVSACPWTPGNKLIRIGIQAKTTPADELPPSNMVLLIDVSGSMSSPDKLELLKKGFSLLVVKKFTERDRISIVTYAGNAAVLLEPTAGDQKIKILHAIDQLGAGGSTAGAQGIITAYALAQKGFIEGGNNRVILGSDGDFNVGISSQEELVKLIEEKRDLGIFLTVLGVGRGNLNDGMMEQVADKGNGTYEYIDNLTQAERVFVDEFNKFYPAAKDVKVQVEFNKDLVQSYRLIGYENRKLENEDFEDDKKDAGEISDGQNITALYEIKPAAAVQFRLSPTFTIKFRYKRPDENVSIPLDLAIYDVGHSFEASSEYMRFTAGVAGFGLMLRESSYKGNLTYDNILSWTGNLSLSDPHHLKAEFSSLVTKAKGLSK